MEVGKKGEGRREEGRGRREEGAANIADTHKKKRKGKCGDTTGASGEEVFFFSFLVWS